MKKKKNNNNNNNLSEAIKENKFWNQSPCPYCGLPTFFDAHLSCKMAKEENNNKNKVKLGTFYCSSLYVEVNDEIEYPEDWNWAKEFREFLDKKNYD